jgi:hypothetical protein
MLQELREIRQAYQAKEDQLIYSLILERDQLLKHTK